MSIVTVASVANRFKSVISAGGEIAKARIAAAHPDEFQFQFYAFELTDYRGERLDLLTFPVSPRQTTDSASLAVDVKKTASGVITHFNPHFVPRDITLRGTFGRSFKFLPDRGAARVSSGVRFGRNAEFSRGVKGGYGVRKALEEIIDGSLETDGAGRANLLYYYNAMAGENYLVEVTNKRFDMTEDRNDLINYTITMKAVAPASATPDKTADTSTSGRFNRGILARIGDDLLREGIGQANRNLGVVLGKI